MSVNFLCIRNRVKHSEVVDYSGNILHIALKIHTLTQKNTY